VLLTSLPTNRIEAWKVIKPSRIDAAMQGSAPAATAIFQRRFLKDLDDLRALCADAHWKDASAVGGYAWRGVAHAVSDLVEALTNPNPSTMARRPRGGIWPSLGPRGSTPAIK